MAYEIPCFYNGILPANVDLSAKQFHAVAVGAATNTAGAGFGGAAAVLPAAGGKILGVAQNNPVIGEATQVMSLGVTKIAAGGHFVIGDDLMVTNDGVFVIATATNRIVATAVENGEAGTVSTAYLQDLGIKPA